MNRHMADRLETIRFKGDIATRRRFFVAEALAHPAKMASGVFLECLERYSKPGDTVLDVMAGSGTALLGALYGRTMILIELERHFCLPMAASWRKIQAHGPALGHGLGEAVIIQGDARCLPLGRADAILTSPPFQETLATQDTWKGEHAAQLGKSYRDNHPGAKQPPGNKRPSYWAAEGQGYTRPAAIITSPPYEHQIHPNSDTPESIEAIPWTNPKKGGKSPHSQFRAIEGYAKMGENIGTLRGDRYLSEISKVYAECWRVLRPGGLLCLVLKGFTRAGKYVDLPGQTEALLLAAGWVKHDEWRRELYSLSFWRILQKRRNPGGWDDRLNFESVLAFRKPSQPLALPTIAGAFVESGIYEVKDVTVFANGLFGMVGHDIFASEYVVAVCDSLKMSGIDAGRIAAKMVKFQAIRDEIARHLEGESMRHNMTAGPICATTYGKHSIATGASIALPFPTALCFVDLRPETSGNILAYTCFCSTCSQKPMVVHGTKPTTEDHLAAILGSAYVHMSIIDQWRSTVNDTGGAGPGLDAVITSPPYEGSLDGQGSGATLDPSKSPEWHPGPNSQVRQKQGYTR